MSQNTQIEAKALEAAKAAYEETLHNDNLGDAEHVIRAYLAALRTADPVEAPAPSEEPVACKRCQGNGEVVTDWDRHLSPHTGDKGDETVAECTDCGGTGITYQTERPCACRPATDVIAWQYRYRMWNTGDWSAWSVPTLDKSDSNDDWEWRPLFASPAVAPVAPAVVMDKLLSCVCLLEVMADSAKERDDQVEWAMMSVMAKDGREVLNGYQSE